MLITDYRALQRTDLRDTGASAYFADPELDGFHRRALDEYARYCNNLKRFELIIPAAQAVTPLPADFIAPDPKTFLNAVGAVPSAAADYTDLYSQSEAFQPSTGGLESSFAGSSYLNWLYGPLQTTTQPTTSATILPGSPPSLLLDPAPASAVDAFVLYNADYALPTTSVVGSLADRESGIVLDYACHLACEALLGDPTFLQSYKIADEAVNRAAVVAAITAKSVRKRKSFDQWTRNRPIGMMG
jgi:hypothetical protein